MMNIEIPITARLITTYLALMFVAVFGFAFLFFPVRTIVNKMRGPASPIGIAFTALFNRVSNILAFVGTETTPAKSLLMSCGLIGYSADHTFKNNVHFWFTQFWLWLPSAIFRHAEMRTKDSIAITVVFKFLFTKLASNHRMLRWVFFCPSRLQAAFLRAKSTSEFIRIKLFIADFTRNIILRFSTLFITGTITELLSPKFGFVFFVTPNANLQHNTCIVQAMSNKRNFSRGRMPGLP